MGAQPVADPPQGPHDENDHLAHPLAKCGVLALSADHRQRGLADEGAAQHGIERANDAAVGSIDPETRLVCLRHHLGHQRVVQFLLIGVEGIEYQQRQPTTQGIFRSSHGLGTDKISAASAQLRPTQDELQVGMQALSTFHLMRSLFPSGFPSPKKERGSQMGTGVHKPEICFRTTCSAEFIVRGTTRSVAWTLRIRAFERLPVGRSEGHGLQSPRYVWQRPPLG